MGGHNSLITGAACNENKIFTFSMDGKVCIWNRESLMREGDIREMVNGGILCGSYLKGYLVVSGNDLVTKLKKSK